MAKILRGKRKGEDVEMHQFCNDWITDTQGKVHNITALEFTDAEITEMKNGDSGVMFDRFTLTEWNNRNRFKKKKS